MKSKIELDAGDIRHIVSQHFGVEEEEVTVSPRARVLIPGDAEPAKPAPTSAAPEPARVPTEPARVPTEPNPAPQTVKEPERTTPASEPKSRVERLFGPREDWNTPPPADDQPEAEGSTARPVKGFLIIRCRNCGKSKSFFLREYATATRCAGCGEEIPLDGNLLRPAYMKCPACENAIRYQTNFMGERIELNCKKCGSPVDQHRGNGGAGMKKKKPGPAITMYHFCAARDVRAIMAEGLTKGMTPAERDGVLGLIQGTQWLTTDKDPARQSWNTNTLVPYSRTAYRLTVSIPHSHRKKLVTAADFVKELPPNNLGLLDWPGSEHWHIYLGNIPPAWIVGVKKMEANK